MEKFFKIALLLFLGSAPVCKPMDESEMDAKILKAIAQLHFVDKDERVMEDAHGAAKFELMQSAYRKRLKNFAPAIIEALKDDLKSDQSAILLSLLPLPEEIKKKLLSSDHTPDIVKAKLGDQAAETRVIAEFKKAKAEDKGRWGSRLFYIDTPNVMKEFVKALESKEIFKNVHDNTYSQVNALLVVYGQHHPEEPLFSYTEFQKHNVSAEEFKKREHQDYLRKVEAFFREKYKIDVMINPPLLLDAHIIPYWTVPVKSDGK